jgi:glutathione S-transferase
MGQVMNVNDWYLFQGVANVIVFHCMIGPRVMGLTPDGAAMPKARAVFVELARLLCGQPYFAGDAVSLADFDGRAAARIPQPDAGMVGARRAG